MQENKTGMSLIVRRYGLPVAALSFVLGALDLLGAAHEAEKGFSGGFLIAASFVLLILIFGKEIKFTKIIANIARRLDLVAGIVFIALISCSAFINIAAGLKIAVGLFVLFIAFLLLETTGNK